MIDKLKPCPFCGRDVALRYNSSTNTFDFWHKYGLSSCAVLEPIELDGEKIKSLKEAVSAWNMRSTNERVEEK